MLVFCAEFSHSTLWNFSKIDLKCSPAYLNLKGNTHISSFLSCHYALILWEIVRFPMYLKIPHWSLICSGMNPSSGCDSSAAGCPEGSFGPSCESSCQCQNGAACDHVSGACTCTAGWTGTFCERGTAAPPGPFWFHREFVLFFIQRAGFTMLDLNEPLNLAGSRYRNVSSPPNSAKHRAGCQMSGTCFNVVKIRYMLKASAVSHLHEDSF